jgi:hypothetical protein
MPTPATAPARSGPGPGDDPLGNAVWHALHGGHADRAERRGAAVRYPRVVTVFAALPDRPDVAAWADLDALVGPGGRAVLFRERVERPPSWAVEHELPGVQLVAPPGIGRRDEEAVVLTAADRPEATALVEATRPGPWRPGTMTMGRYVGLRRQGRLVALAGEGLRPTGHVEISAVCTPPRVAGPRARHPPGQPPRRRHRGRRGRSLPPRRGRQRARHPPLPPPRPHPVPRGHRRGRAARGQAGTVTAGVVIVGVGPRGLMVLERLLARAAEQPDHPLVVHLVDPHPPGGGRVWRHDQDHLLRLNSTAEDVTAFPDASVGIDGPLRTGPTLAEWAALVPPGGLCDAALEVEAATLGPLDFASRRLAAAYFGWARQHLVEHRPAHVQVRTWAAEVGDITSLDDRERVHLAGGEVIEADAVVLTLGHLDAEPDPARAAAADACRAAGVTYLPPGYAADMDLDVLAPGEDVVVRGIGLAFVDLMVLLTEGRGGRFSPLGDGPGLAYRPSGREPRLHVGSRPGRALPLQAGVPAARRAGARPPLPDPRRGGRPAGRRRPDRVPARRLAPARPRDRLAPLPRAVPRPPRPRLGDLGRVRRPLRRRVLGLRRAAGPGRPARPPPSTASTSRASNAPSATSACPAWPPSRTTCGIASGPTWTGAATSAPAPTWAPSSASWRCSPPWAGSWPRPGSTPARS